MARVVAITKPEAAEAEPLDERAVLIERRAELMAEAQRLGKVAEARRAVEARLTELDGEQAAIDATEREAWRAWAQNDAQGPPPASRIAAREDVARRRTLLAGDLAGALNGERAVEPRLAALNAELRDTGLKISRRTSTRSCLRRRS
jgi:hypothetical protein